MELLHFRYLYLVTPQHLYGFKVWALTCWIFFFWSPCLLNLFPCLGPLSCCITQLLRSFSWWTALDPDIILKKILVNLGITFSPTWLQLVQALIDWQQSKPIHESPFTKRQQQFYNFYSVPHLHHTIIKLRLNCTYNMCNTSDKTQLLHMWTKQLVPAHERKKTPQWPQK